MDTTTIKAQSLIAGDTFQADGKTAQVLHTSPMDVAGFSLQVIDTEGNTYYFSPGDVVELCER